MQNYLLRLHLVHRFLKRAHASLYSLPQDFSTPVETITPPYYMGYGVQKTLKISQSIQIFKEQNKLFYLNLLT